MKKKTLSVIGKPLRKIDAMKANEGDLPLSLEYARREDRMLAPVTIPRSEAPVKEVIKRGDEANVYDLPVVRHHAMDPAPYIDMATSSMARLINRMSRLTPGMGRTYIFKSYCGR